MGARTRKIKNGGLQIVIQVEKNRTVVNRQTKKYSKDLVQRNNSVDS